MADYKTHTSSHLELTRQELHDAINAQFCGQAGDIPYASAIKVVGNKGKVDEFRLEMQPNDDFTFTLFWSDASPETTTWEKADLTRVGDIQEIGQQMLNNAERLRQEREATEPKGGVLIGFVDKWTPEQHRQYTQYLERFNKREDPGYTALTIEEYFNSPSYLRDFQENRLTREKVRSYLGRDLTPGKDTRPPEVSPTQQIIRPFEVPVEPPKGLSPENWLTFFKTMPDHPEEVMRVMPHYNTHLLMSDSCNDLMNAAREEGRREVTRQVLSESIEVFHDGKRPIVGQVWRHEKNQKEYIIRAIVHNTATDHLDVTYDPYLDEMPDSLDYDCVDEFSRPIHHGDKAFLKPGRFTYVKTPPVKPPKPIERVGANEEPKYVGIIRQLIRAGSEFEKSTSSQKWADALRKWRDAGLEAVKYLSLGGWKS